MKRKISIKIINYTIQHLTIDNLLKYNYSTLVGRICIVSQSRRYGYMYNLLQKDNKGIDTTKINWAGGTKNRGIRIYKKDCIIYNYKTLPKVRTIRCL